MVYSYLGDKLHRAYAAAWGLPYPRLCRAMRNKQGKSIKHGSKILVSWEDGSQGLVICRMLRKVNK